MALENAEIDIYKRLDAAAAEKRPFPFQISSIMSSIMASMLSKPNAPPPYTIFSAFSGSRIDEQTQWQNFVKSKTGSFPNQIFSSRAADSYKVGLEIMIRAWRNTPKAREWFALQSMK